ncbi:MAG: chromosome segregation protein SMC [Pedosphaera sp.]|nr:chromosome segregation protein SMC [Pedosphaera sp.]
MYLKNLTVLGFKSFADKTSLNFQPGVTAIVGPNGCGKSNVSDAIRWVLGEQSAKALRGGEMADVIFNGTDGRKALGMAEVSLTIGDVDTEHLKAAGIPVEFNEIMVTRRVFRDGGSEYFINRVPSRLRDIQQLFMGTGVGRTSYSIMAQGNITQILSSKPDDRRMVFEEAAGITRFKAQKKEALRKLEHTDQNLLRVEDLIKEVKRQIGSLQRQAGKARRFKSLQAELQHLETQLARHQFDVLQSEILERTTQAEKLKTEGEICQESVLRLEDEILQLRAALSELEKTISVAQRHGLELKAESERNDSRIGFNEERLRELAAQHERALADILLSRERHQISAAELMVVKDRISEAEVQVKSLRESLEEKRLGLTAVERDVSEKQEALRLGQSQAFGAAQQLARVRNEINALDLQKQGNVVRLEKLHAEKFGAEEERTRLESRLEEFSSQVEAERLHVQASRGTVEERQARLRELHQEINDAGQRMDPLIRQQAETRSRLSVLEQLDTSHEGFGSGAQAALKGSDAVLGTLADKLRVGPEHVLPIETALGHHLQLVLTADPGVATAILADLHAHKKGRASIAALALSDAGVNSENSLDVEQVTLADSLGGTVPALSVLTCDPAVRPLLTALLGQTRIVADLPTATAAHRQTRGRFDYVTLAGDLLTRHGVYTGGTANPSGKAPASILGRKNQIAELHGQLTRLTEQVAESTRQKVSLQGEQTELQASLEEARTELRHQEVAIATRQGEFNALQNSRRSLQARFDNAVQEHTRLSAQENEGSEKRQSLATQIAELEATEQTAVGQVHQMTADLERLRQSRDLANSALSDAKVALAMEEQLLASHSRQRAPLEQRIQEMEQLVARLETESGSFNHRQQQFETEISECRGQIERLRHDREGVSNQITARLTEKLEQEVQVQRREDNLREHRSRLTRAQQERGQLEVELAQKTMSVQNLRERVQEKYQMNLDDIRGEGIRITLADEGQPRVETLSPEEMQEVGLSTDWGAVAEQVGSLQQRLEEIGPVNLVAIEEYEETEQRHAFLTTQHDDLVKAKEQLTEVLNKINVETKVMFFETFEKIRANFQLMFTEMFGGGKADLRLVDEGDVLESGIDIIARPPGKQLQSISLLSGGEQTMTAVALLFSIYQVKPSPFCVLDELDAPLDESNINRFIKVLQRFLEHSQFVVITHNKRTIGMADILYGVTMQEQGVSKIVSVKFNKESSGAERSTEVAGTAESVRGGRSAGDQEVVLAK